MNRYLLILILVNVFTINLFPQSSENRWIYFATSKTGDKHYIDKNYNRLADSKVRAWQKRVFSNSSYWLYLDEYDCIERRTRFLKLVKYNSYGELTNSEDVNSRNWVFVTPSTIEEHALNLVCGNESIDTPKQPQQTKPKDDEYLDKLFASVEKKTKSNSPTVPKYQSSNNDVGVDIAVLIVQKANLREQPDISSEVVREVGKNNLLVLLDRNPNGVWYKVLDVQSSDEGWIHGNNIEIQYTTKPKKSLSLQEYKTNSNENPYVVISNDSYKTLTLTVGDQKIVIPANNKRTVYLSPGNYTFYATAQGVIPAFGERVFNAGSWYTWSFFIVTK